MIEEVNKIIYNMLISGRGVLLPEIGALYIERQAARKLADGRLLTPRNVVLFSKQEQAPSLVDEIVAIASCSKEQAQDIYERWRAKTYQQGVLTIGGIGELKGGSFTMDKGFMSVINPQGVKTIVVRKKSSNKWLYAVVGVAVLVALGFFVYVMWGDKIMGGANEKPAQEQVVAPEPTVAEQTIAADSVAVQPQAVEQPQEVKRSEYAYYVVMGIFSTPENAERAVSQVQSKIKDVECVVLPFKGGKHMVTIFGGDSAADCNAFARSYRDIYPDLW
ncbi:MAG: hypothetical protein IIW87_09265, partial [Alistipes sp.]|nr:hypothetical protein [Alistipes sp.]